jgi:adenosylcobinamide-phosphate synthase
MNIALVIAMALGLDYLLGEPRRYHPLVGFGCLADTIEARLNRGDSVKVNGMLAWLLAVVPLLGGVYLLDRILMDSEYIYLVWCAGMLYLTLGWRSLMQHAQDVLQPLTNGDIVSARRAVSRIVSRDADVLDETGVARGAIESVLENGADAIFATIFWFCLLGVPGAVLYRLSNTLDAMWGYRNSRFRQFGWMAARIDDWLNYIPARLTALTYALLGDTRAAFHYWKTQGTVWKSPNAGPVMAAGAGSLNVSLGGAETYQGELQQRSVLGPENSAQTRASSAALAASCRLVNKSILLWLLVIALLDLLV